MSKKPAGETLYVILGLLFIAVIGLRTISTPELWTHLAQGQHNAPISFLASDSAVNTTWLYDKLAYLMWSIGKAPLLILLNIVGLVGAFVLLLRVSEKWGGALSQGFALLIAGHLMFQMIDVGPEVCMMLFIALFLYLLTTQKSPAVLFGALIPLQILWTNLHGSFLFGPILAGLVAAQAAQQAKPSGGRKKNQTNLSGTLGLLAIALLVATLINPSFIKLHGQVIAGIQSPAPVYHSSLFIEYFQIPALKPLILFTMILGAGGLITLKKRLPLTLTAIAVFGAFLVWTSPYHAMLFAILSLPFIVLSLTAISEYIHSSLEQMLGGKAKLVPGIMGGVLVLLFIASIIPAATGCAYVKAGKASRFGLGVQEEQFPADCEAIFNHPAFPEKCINLAADGGYLAFKYGRKCFIDYRPGRYDTELLKNLELLMLGDPKAYDAIYDEYRPEAFVINTLTPHSAQGIYTLLAKKTWKLAYFDGTTAILLLNKDAFSDLLNNPAIQQAGLAKLEAARAAYAEKGGACSAGNPAELIGAGKVYLAFNRPTEAKAIFSLLLKGNARSPAAWLGLGTSQLMLKEPDAAVASLKIATRHAPQNALAWSSYARACKIAGLSAEADIVIAKARELAERNKVEEIPEPKKVETKAKELSLEELAVPTN
ncbi:tetratricopeptide repeat protein [Pontiella sp.]|uniref:tetratricopeptide repeat protein n=2 Tax=Pontiella sp. TaxID=2837462 RepID=UPI0035692772